MDDELEMLAERIGSTLSARQLILATAESCTGGWIAKCVTDVAGSSAWFDRGFVTYSNLAKQEMLGVDASTLQAYGAVSEPVVREMASGAVDRSNATVSVAVSGVAGPTGGTASKPVGQVCFAWRLPNRIIADTRRFGGDRRAVRRAAAEWAMQRLIDGLVDE